MNATVILRETKADFGASKLIMVNRVIRTYLRRLAGDDTLYRALKECNRGFDFRSEYARAASNDGFSPRFLIPNSKRSVVALVTGLLYNFDAHTENSVSNFILAYYPADTAQASYTRFLNELIYPYLAAFQEILLAEDGIAEEEKEEEPPAPAHFPDAAREDAERWVKCLLDIVIGDNEIYESERADRVLMLNGLMYVLGENNPLLVPIVWTGLKHTFGHYPKGERELGEIERILKNYGALGQCS